MFRDGTCPTYMEYKTVLGRIVLSLQSPEQRLLGSQYLDGTGGCLGQVHQAASMCYEPSSD